MPSPPVAVFLTTIASQPALRQRQEYLLRILQVKKVPFTSYDLASDELAKKLWRRKAPVDKQQLPGILVGNKFPGTFTDFEEAVECNTLSTFLRLDEDWEEDENARPNPPQQTLGVPGVVLPLQMTPERIRTKILAGTSREKGKIPSVPVNKRSDEKDVGEELTGFGLQGVKVTDDELIALVAELGLEGDEAGDLVKGLGVGSSKKDRAPKEHVDKVEKVKNTPEPASVKEVTPPIPAKEKEEQKEEKEEEQKGEQKEEEEKLVVASS
ncbi:hypothetical protein BDN72DRAFT_754998 [Pluteus cervinus]|uniref:Uncharacterized protein n=1 Tax=Pluteus cervinus TaxID=181527 RepID=A0ACD3BHD0_9AGAR|nr:hypothetical protein BDN72DRAFT_754998 [Pluteus cervinus]